MGYHVQHLEPGTLYLTLSVSHQPSHYRPNYSKDTTAYLPPAIGPGDPNHFESTVARANTMEEFQWGLYFHRQLRDGTRYTLRRTQPILGDTIPGITQPVFELVRERVEQSPRLDFSVVGLIRGLAVSEDVAKSLTSYLDWLTLQTAIKAQRTFMWATSVFFRTRKHVLKMQRHNDLPESIVESLLQEALEFAYREVWYTLGRQLPRPILASSHLSDNLAIKSDESPENSKKFEAEREKIKNGKFQQNPNKACSFVSSEQPLKTGAQSSRREFLEADNI